MPLPFLGLGARLLGLIGFLSLLGTEGTGSTMGLSLVVLQGLSAVGKTTVARCLARRYRSASIDTNAIKRRMGITHDQLFEHAEMEGAPCK